MDSQEESVAANLHFTEKISAVSLQNCNRVNKVHRGVEKGKGGGLPGRKPCKSKGTVVKYHDKLGGLVGLEPGLQERTRLEKRPECGLDLR